MTHQDKVLAQQCLVRARLLERLGDTHAPALVVVDPERLVEVPLPQAVHRVNRVLEHHVQVAAVDNGNI